jgi:hypothetical protein
MLYYVDTGRVTYIAMCIQCGLDTFHLKLLFLFKKFIQNTIKRCLVFATSYFVLKMLFSSMLSSYELSQRKQCSCHVYMREISES